jgi:hypothetical protein
MKSGMERMVLRFSYRAGSLTLPRRPSLRLFTDLENIPGVTLMLAGQWQRQVMPWPALICAGTVNWVAHVDIFHLSMP